MAALAALKPEALAVGGVALINSLLDLPHSITAVQKAQSTAVSKVCEGALLQLLGDAYALARELTEGERKEAGEGEQERKRAGPGE